MADILIPKLHSGQQEIWDNRSQFNIVCCGRRFGKTKLMVAISASASTKGLKTGLFTPEHKQLAEPYSELEEILNPIIKRSSKTAGEIRLKTRGLLDFWAVNDNELAGRGREYHVGSMDEAAFGKDKQLLEIWRRSIKPTLLTTRGSFWLFSTPNGINQDNFFYQAWHDPELGFKQFHAPTANNPYVPLDELEKERLTAHPLVWKQEFLAEFVSWDSATFFKLDYFLDNGLPVGYPTKCDAVFAVLDCAAKSGTNNDATGVVYFAVSLFHGFALTILDYEMHSIDAAMLEFLAPVVLEKCESLAKECNARNGSMGAMVEDAAGGIVLLQQARAKGWDMRAIPSALMAKGKDERAMIAGGPAYQGLCKLSRHAFDKTVEWKGRTQNHLIHQLTTFRIGDKEAYRRADDLLDCVTYGIALTLSDQRAL